MFGVGSLASYGNFCQIGEGTFGYVYRATDKKSGEIVALKRLIFHKESSGFPLCSVREIKFLRSLKHKNIVALKEIVNSKGCEHLDASVASNKKNQNKDFNQNEEKGKEKDETSENMVVKLCGNLYLVFEYIEHDLGGLVDAKYKFNQRAIKCITKQLFEALDYLNDKKVIHRDIKTSNILLSNLHQLKLADFGLARSSSSIDGREGKQDLTNNVVTMWYKSPELLLGSTHYSNAIDIWSSGCVLAELELGRPIFPGKTEIEQFDLISKILGYPTEDSYSNLSTLPKYESLIKNNGNKYSNVFRSVYTNKISEQALSLLERIFTLDPSRRPSPKIILTHSYFFTYPTPPNNPTELEPLQLTPGSSLHEFETKLKRKLALKEQNDKDSDNNGNAAMNESQSALLCQPVSASNTDNLSNAATMASMGTSQNQSYVDTMSQIYQTVTTAQQQSMLNGLIPMANYPLPYSMPSNFPSSSYPMFMPYGYNPVTFPPISIHETLPYVPISTPGLVNNEIRNHSIPHISEQQILSSVANYGNIGNSTSVIPNESVENSNKILCAFYMKTGRCRFEKNCKFLHPNLPVSNRVMGIESNSDTHQTKKSRPNN